MLSDDGCLGLFTGGRELSREARGDSEEACLGRIISGFTNVVGCLAVEKVDEVAASLSVQNEDDWNAAAASDLDGKDWDGDLTDFVITDLFLATIFG